MVNKRGTLLMGTGTGKTRIGVLACKKILDEGLVTAVRIVVPTTNLIQGWITEFVKWNMEEILKHVEIGCIQTFYKEDHSLTLESGRILPSNTFLIVDEVHTSLSPQYRSLYSVDWKYILGLTATLPSNEEDYVSVLHKYAPPVFTYTLSEGVKDNIISPFSVYNLPVSFTQKERVLYNIHDSNFKKAQIALTKYNNQLPKEEKFPSVFDLARHYKDISSPIGKEAKAFWSGMTLRKHICFNASNKLNMCIQIIEKYPNRKWIVFSKSKKFVDELYQKLTEENIKSIKYHSGMSSNDRIASLNVANNPDTRVICSATALNAGYDLPELDGAIVASGVSSELTNTQQTGRICRFKEGKEALVVNLYVDKTQERKWIESKLKGLEHQ